MYEQKRTEVNKAAEKYEKAIKAAKRSGNKANQVPCMRSSSALFSGRIGPSQDLPRQSHGLQYLAKLDHATRTCCRAHRFGRSLATSLGLH